MHTRNILPLVLASAVVLTAACYNAGTSQPTPQTYRNSNVSSPQPSGEPARQSSTSVEESKSNCDPNYTPCVPIASDVDCAGGGGNGPAYVRGPIRVIGTDIYGLDRDGDGIACEK